MLTLCFTMCLLSFNFKGNVFWEYMYTSPSLMTSPSTKNSVLIREMPLMRWSATCIHSNCCQNMCSLRRGVLSRECPLRKGPLYVIDDWDWILSVEWVFSVWFVTGGTVPDHAFVIGELGDAWHCPELSDCCHSQEHQTISATGDTGVC